MQGESQKWALDVWSWFFKAERWGSEVRSGSGLGFRKGARGVAGHYLGRGKGTLGRVLREEGFPFEESAYLEDVTLIDPIGWLHLASERKTPSIPID